MNTLRKMLIGLAGFVCILAVSSFVSLLALRTTVMDREVVKEWLITSNIYDGRLISALAETVDAGDAQSSTQQFQTNISASPGAVKTALNAAFTPEFVQAQVENVISRAYDWTEGKSPEFTFSIPVDQKHDVLIQQLARAVEPQIAALPICVSAQQSSCRPPNLTVEQFSSQLTTESINKSGALAVPITNESVTKDKQSDISPLTQLPSIRAAIDVLLYTLPIVALACVVVVIFATAKEHRLLAALRLSRRIFVSMLLILIPAGVMIWIAQSNDLGLVNNFTNQISDVVMPLIRIVVVAVSSKLALFSGIISMVSLTTWIGLAIWRRKLRAAEAVHVSAAAPAMPTVGIEMTQPPHDVK